MRRAAAACLAALSAGACAGGAGLGPAPAPSPPRPGISAVPITPRTAGDPLPGIIGARADELLAALGQPRLDLIEGDARKLQFAAPECVLDIYLYPAMAGAAPQATYAEARARADGAALPGEDCLAAIRSGGR